MLMRLQTWWLGLLQMRRRWQGLISGALLWLAWMIFGFWSTLLLLVLGGIGYAIGRVLEERWDWKNLLDKLLTDRFKDD